MTDHATLAALRSMHPGVERIRAIGDYIKQGEEQLREARKLRNADVRALVGDLGPAQVAKASGLSLSSIKSITRSRGP
ncbi:MAG TPA: hypothetical protein VK735_42705 [Pseudonocardia sp.]|uniref:hypothetical protein n=1 Tax=Pseudonocardia sp. TaxID=60912 RepID=UPI002C56F93B|nr:hypothetical protein [Pseudonocardia sp.]HTF54199.1 hypothetical protein [Pseudonocardia sp.]